jgi:hypothetical protein
MIKKHAKQEQKVDNGGVAIQAAGNVIVNGVSYSEVKQISLDVCRNYLEDFASKGRDKATARVEEITDKFLVRLKNENPDGFRKAEDPDFQYALLSVQKEYARSGDENLGDLLVDILVDRSKQDIRNILQIVLNESLFTAPKLTKEQLAALSIIFLFRYTQNHSISNFEKLGNYFDKHVLPIIESVVKNLACYQHLQYCGCGSMSTGSVSLERILKDYYQGLFVKGFDNDIIIDQKLDSERNKEFFITCLNDSTKIQVNALTINVLNGLLERKNVVTTDREKIIELFNSNRMSDPEIMEKCISCRPYISTLFDVWNNSQMKYFILTSVGIAIGHANLRRFLDEEIDLKIWIN